MKRRYYFDTSVFGGVFDEEFKKYSIQLFEQVKRGRVVCLYSEVVERELENAPKHVIEYFDNLPSAYMKRLIISDEVRFAADEYINKKVVGDTSYDDCLHLAIATVNYADAVTSWNFRHIVNSERIEGYNSVNLSLGYPEIRICSPLELFLNEKEN